MDYKQATHDLRAFSMYVKIHHTKNFRSIVKGFYIQREQQIKNLAWFGDVGVQVEKDTYEKLISITQDIKKPPN